MSEQRGAVSAGLRNGGNPDRAAGMIRVFGTARPRGAAYRMRALLDIPFHLRTAMIGISNSTAGSGGSTLTHALKR